MDSLYQNEKILSDEQVPVMVLVSICGQEFSYVLIILIMTEK